MARHRARIDAPAEVVYGLIADANRRASWLPELESVDAPTDRLLVEGDRFEGYTALPGHRFVGSSVVTDARPPYALAERVVIGARFTTRWDVEPDGDGAAIVTHTIDVEFPAGPMGRLERIVLSRWLGRMQRAALRRLASVAR